MKGIPLAVILILLSTGLSFTGAATEFKESENLSFQSAKIPHEPISIIGNSDFLNQKLKFNWNGTGEIQDPIVISGYLIESNQDCISIINVSLHFKIVSCEMTLIGFYSGNGISFYNCSNGFIMDCDIYMKKNGIFIVDSQLISIDDVTLHDCNNGINIIQSSFIHVSNNILDRNDFDGLILNFTFAVYCHDNTLSGNGGCGFLCVDDESTHFQNNEVSLGWAGISSLNSRYWVCEELIVSNCDFGVLLSNTLGGYLLNSIIHHCSYQGILLDIGTSNISIIENVLGPGNGENALDNGINNYWDNPHSLTGNIWSDYNGTGFYFITGSAGSIDHHPTRIPDSTSGSTNATSVTSTTTSGNTSIGDFPMTEIAQIVSIESVAVILLMMILIFQEKK